ncbi:MAG: hypothetical protein AAF911_15250, partial [Planctomycetota bacterium]
MSTPALRPSFRLPLRLPPDEAMAALERGLAESDAPILSQRAGHHMTLTVTPAVRHFWSPWLNLEFEPAETAAERGADPTPEAANRTSLHARFSPAPSLWTGFMAVYFTLATAGFLALMWAAAQWTMGSRPTLLWATLACALGCGGLWWCSLVGQKLAHDQMHLLRRAVVHTLDSNH